jgi:hypothetical protein
MARWIRVLINIAITAYFFWMFLFLCKQPDGFDYGIARALLEIFAFTIVSMLFIVVCAAAFQKHSLMENAYLAMEQYPVHRKSKEWKAWKKIWLRGYAKNDPDRSPMDCWIAFSKSGIALKGFTPPLIPGLACRLHVPWESVETVERIRLPLSCGLFRRNGCELTFEGSEIRVLVPEKFCEVMQEHYSLPEEESVSETGEKRHS